MADINKIVAKFCTDGKATSIAPCGNGLVNHTFVVNTQNEGKVTRYLLQAINKNVFPDGPQLVDNIYKITTFLKTKTNDPKAVITLIPTKDGKYYHIDGEGVCWRMSDFLDDVVCLERFDSLDEFEQCAYGFGNFQRQLSDFPVDTLFETIKNFHNTPLRYETFLKAVEEDKLGRRVDVEEEIAFFKSEKDFYPVLFNANKEGKLPIRVTHNDTKTNNVMLDAATRKAVRVIDLDTVMPGFSVNDFGDAIRFGANTAAEDERDLSKVSLDLELFDVYTRGFLKGCAGGLTEDEVMLLPEGAKMMTIECGMRFLTDYLQGDVYFKTSYPGHNLDRTRTQIELVRDMNRKWQVMKDIVKKYI